MVTVQYLLRECLRNLIIYGDLLQLQPRRHYSFEESGSQDRFWSWDWYLKNIIRNLPKMMCAWPSVIMRQPGNLTKLLKKQAKKVWSIWLRIPAWPGSDLRTAKRVWRKSAELQLFPMWKLKVYSLTLQEQMNTTAPRQWFSWNDILILRIFWKKMESIFHCIIVPIVPE